MDYEQLPDGRWRRKLADYADLSALRAEDGGNVLMSDAMNLPPLPLRYDLVTRANPETGGYRDVPVYSADDMRAYGEACAAEEHKRMNAVLAAQSAAHHREVQEQVAAEREACAAQLDRTGNDHCAATIRAREET